MYHVPHLDTPHMPPCAGTAMYTLYMAAPRLGTWWQLYGYGHVHRWLTMVCGYLLMVVCTHDMVVVVSVCGARCGWCVRVGGVIVVRISHLGVSVCACMSYLGGCAHLGMCHIGCTCHLGWFGHVPDTPYLGCIWGVCNPPPKWVVWRGQIHPIHR